jgi:hypothetical protein
MALERVHARKHFLTDTLLGGAIGAFTMDMFYAWSFTRTELRRSWLGPLAPVALVGRWELDTTPSKSVRWVRESQAVPTQSQRLLSNCRCLRRCCGASA